MEEKKELIKEYRKREPVEVLREIEEVCKPILKYLNDIDCGSCLTFIITHECIKLLSDEVGIPTCCLTKND